MPEGVQKESISLFYMCVVTRYPKDLSKFLNSMLDFEANFFSSEISKISERTVVNIVIAFNWIGYNYGYTKRDRFVQIADLSFQKLTEIWRERGTNDILKYEICRFLHFGFSFKDVVYTNLDELFFFFRDILNSNVIHFRDNSKGLISESQVHKREYYFYVVSQVFASYMKPRRDQENTKRRKLVSVEQELVEVLEKCDNAYVLENWILFAKHLVNSASLDCRAISWHLIRLFGQRRDVSLVLFETLAVLFEKEILSPFSFPTKEVLEIVWKVTLSETVTWVAPLLKIVSLSIQKFIDQNIIDHIISLLDSVYFTKSEHCSVESLDLIASIFSNETLKSHGKIHPLRLRLIGWILTSYRCNECFELQSALKYLVGSPKKIDVSSKQFPCSEDTHGLNWIEMVQNPLKNESNGQNDTSTPENLTPDTDFLISLFTALTSVDVTKINIVCLQILIGTIHRIEVSRLNSVLKEYLIIISLCKSLIDLGDKGLSNHALWIVSAAHGGVAVDYWVDFINSVLMKLFDDQVSGDLIEEDILETRPKVSKKKSDISFQANVLKAFLIKFPTRISSHEELIENILSSDDTEARLCMLEVLVAEKKLDDKSFGILKELLSRLVFDPSRIKRLVSVLLKQHDKSLSQNDITRLNSVINLVATLVEKPCHKEFKIAIIDFLEYCLISDGPKFCEKVGEVLHILLSDTSISVSLAASRSFPKLLDSFDENDVFSILKSFLDENKEDYEKKRVGAWTLTRLSCKSSLIPKILDIWIRQSSDHSMSEISRISINHLVSYCGYGTLQNLLIDSLRYIVSQSLMDKILEKFPVGMFGEQSLASFYIKYSSTIIPIALVAEDANFLRQFAHVTKTSEASIIKDNVAAIHSIQILNPESKIDVYCKKTCKEWEKLKEDHFTDVIYFMLAAHSTSMLDPPMCDRDSVLKAVKIRCASMKKLEEPGVHFSLLLRLSKDLFLTKRSNRRLDLLSSLMILTEVAGTPNVSLSVGRLMIHVFNFLIEHENCVSLACKWILPYVEAVYPVQTTHSTMISSIVPNLMKLAQKKGENEVKLLDSIIYRAKSSMEQSKVLSALEVDHKDLKTSQVDYTIEEILDCLETPSKSGFNRSMVSSLEKYKAFPSQAPALKKAMFYLFEMISSKSKGFEIAEEAVYRLGLCVETSHLEMSREFPMKILGIQDPYSPDDYYLKSKALIVEYLSESLYSRDVLVMDSAYRAILRILNSVSGLNTFKTLPNNVKPFFQDFIIPGLHLSELPDVETPSTGDPRNFAEWVKMTTSMLITSFAKDEVYQILREHVSLDANLAEQAFVHVIYDCFQNKKQSVFEKLSTMFVKLFEDRKTDHKILLLLIHTLNVLRAHSMQEKKVCSSSSLAMDYWLDIPYILVVKVAARCNVPYSALMYLECHCIQVKYSLSKNLVLEEKASEEDILFIEIYKKLNDFDSLAAFGNVYGPKSLLGKFEMSQNWTDALGMYESRNLGNQRELNGLVSTLLRLGHLNLTSLLVQNVGSDPIVQSTIFEHAWKTMSWNVAIASVKPDFNFYIHQSLRNLHDPTVSNRHLGDAKRFVLDSIKSPQDVVRTLPRLEMIRRIEDPWHSGTHVNQLLHSFSVVEPLLKLDLVLATIRKQEDKIPSVLCEISHYGRKTQQLQYVEGMIYSSKSTAPTVRLEEAKLLWEKGEQDLAISIAKSLEHELKGTAQLQVGIWLEKSKLESRNVIKKYYSESLKTIKDKSKSWFVLGQFYENLYQELFEKMQSDDWKRTIEICDEYDKEIRKHKDTSDQELSMKMTKMRRSNDVTKKDIQDQKENLIKYVLDAIGNYASAMDADSKYSLLAFRICSFWFNNSDKSDVIAKVSKTLETQSLYRMFLPLIYQIASRLGTGTSEFRLSVQMALQSIIRKYPHHSLYQVYALVHGDCLPKDQRGKDYFTADTAKIEAAKKVINSVKKELNPILDNMSLLIEAYLEAAFLPLAPKTYAGRFDSEAKIMKVNGLKHIPIPTVEMSPETTVFESVANFDRDFTTAGGINLPKILKCVSSKGTKYRQLVKGKDDLRQDAVMQQIFDLVNSLFVEKKTLRIRTYKVIPLSPTAGLLGWVENTIPLGNWLQDKAHERYNPKDYTYKQAREKVEKVQELNLTERLAMYNQVCDRFKPCLRHFFDEYFSSPLEIYNRRLAYIRSVATSSMLGYIIGLGDRHSQNILLDYKTAEVVHIDLGIAFDQGKLLRFPERVPFRLTRDIVDGMGIQGVEGVFKKTSEKTMEVLRKNGSLLTTIVEVFLHDPLYSWALSPEKAERVQTEQMMNKKGNRDAHSTVLKLREKLQGYENGEMLSVKGQVNNLINQARDPVLLSQMFSGWASFL